MTDATQKYMVRHKMPASTQKCPTHHASVSIIIFKHPQLRPLRNIFPLSYSNTLFFRSHREMKMKSYRYSNIFDTPPKGPVMWKAVKRYANIIHAQLLMLMHTKCRWVFHRHVHLLFGDIINCDCIDISFVHFIAIVTSVVLLYITISRQPFRSISNMYLKTYSSYTRNLNNGVNHQS